MKKLTAEGKSLCERLWKEYRRDIESECRSLSDSEPSLTDETVSDVYYCLCCAVVAGTEISSYGEWLLRIAGSIYNKHLQDLSKEKARRISISEILNLSAGEMQNDIDDSRFTSEKIEALAPEIMNNMTKTEMEIYSLVYDEERSFKHISERLSITEPAAKQRNYRMREKVKKDIDEIFKKH